MRALQLCAGFPFVAVIAFLIAAGNITLLSLVVVPLFSVLPTLHAHAPSTPALGPACFTFFILSSSMFSTDKCTLHAQVVKTSCHHLFPAQLHAILSFAASHAHDQGDGAAPGVLKGTLLETESIAQLEPLSPDAKRGSQGPRPQRSYRQRQSIAVSFETRQSIAVAYAAQSFERGLPSSAAGSENGAAPLAHAGVRTNQVAPEPPAEDTSRAQPQFVPPAAANQSLIQLRAAMTSSASGSPRETTAQTSHAPLHEHGVVLQLGGH